jgi:hypothetical protein
MDADKCKFFVFNPRLSAFIGGQLCFGLFQQPASLGLAFAAK